MSWLDKINTSLIIKTGDGKEYKPKWKGAEKAIEYNIAEFDFPEVEGTLVDRGTRKGRKFPMEIYFDGEDHLDVSLDFEKSANDSRPWQVTHPYYGIIIVQPVSLNIDNSAYNVSKISGTLLETITDQFPKGTTVPVSKIASDVETTNTALAEAYGNNVSPSASDINQMEANALASYTDGAKFAPPEIAEDYRNAFNLATAMILDAADEPLDAISAMQEVLKTPAEFASSVQTRVHILNSQFSRLSGQVDSITTRNQKYLYQNNAATTVSALALAASTPQASDYGSRTEVLGVIESILATYAQYQLDLDTLQSDNGGSPDSFIPDAQSLQQLNLLVNFTISNLYNIALNSKQERSILLENDSNWILLAHRFYGLAQDDSTIEQMIANNKAGLSEMLQIRKGRKIIYYV